MHGAAGGHGAWRLHPVNSLERVLGTVMGIGFRGMLCQIIIMIPNPP